MDDDHRPVEIADRAQGDGRPDASELRLQLGERLLCHARTLLRAPTPLLAWRRGCDARRTSHRGRRRRRESRPDRRPATRRRRARAHASAVVIRADSTRSRRRSAAPIETDVVDLLDPAATKAWAADLAARHDGRVDGLVHLVGGWRGGAPIEDAPLEDWDFLSALLVRTVQNATQALASSLMASEHGRFVLVSAGQAQAPTHPNAAYAAAKAASETWTLALADRFKGTGATANIVVVGAIVTPAMRDGEPRQGLLDVHAGRRDRRGDRLPLLRRRVVDERPARHASRRGLSYDATAPRARRSARSCSGTRATRHASANHR